MKWVFTTVFFVIAIAAIIGIGFGIGLGVMKKKKKKKDTWDDYYDGYGDCTPYYDSYLDTTQYACPSQGHHTYGSMCHKYLFSLFTVVFLLLF